ncbi:hypothetical protein K523DRAFT_358735 [Schizophyllum commune Tattone D]|nr:hypothetical protein K523DRAFT_358735 [Schizophyllum commune Tattone D]
MKLPPLCGRCAEPPDAHASPSVGHRPGRGAVAFSAFPWSIRCGTQSRSTALALAHSVRRRQQRYQVAVEPLDSRGCAHRAWSEGTEVPFDAGSTQSLGRRPPSESEYQPTSAEGEKGEEASGFASLGKRMGGRTRCALGTVAAGIRGAAKGKKVAKTVAKPKVVLKVPGNPTSQPPSRPYTVRLGGLAPGEIPPFKAFAPNDIFNGATPVEPDAVSVHEIGAQPAWASLGAAGRRLIMADWSGRSDFGITDTDKLVLVKGICWLGDPTWPSIIAGCGDWMEALSRTVAIPASSWQNRCGNSGAVNLSISFGGGQQQPGNLAPSHHNRLAVQEATVHHMFAAD